MYLLYIYQVFTIHSSCINYTLIMYLLFIDHLFTIHWSCIYYRLIMYLLCLNEIYFSFITRIWFYNNFTQIKDRTEAIIRIMQRFFIQSLTIKLSQYDKLYNVGVNCFDIFWAFTSTYLIVVRYKANELCKIMCCQYLPFRRPNEWWLIY